MRPTTKPTWRQATKHDTFQLNIWNENQLYGHMDLSNWDLWCMSFSVTGFKTYESEMALYICFTNITPSDSQCTIFFRSIACVKCLWRRHSHINILLKNNSSKIFSYYLKNRDPVYILSPVILRRNCAFFLEGLGWLWSNVGSQALLEWWTTGYCFMVNSVTRSIAAWLITRQR